MSDTLTGYTTKEINSKRKEEQLWITLNRDVQFKGIETGLSDYQFIHQALPEINLSDVDMSTTLFGKTISAPLVISSMVGGIEPARQINRNLAHAAQAMRVAMGVGSQRPAIDDETVAQTYQVRDIAPDILLFANLGAIQLNNGYGVSECRRAVEMIGADALFLHLNPLQEALQPDGNTNFAGLLKKIEHICGQLSIPVIIKEVGWGISETVARKLADVGVAGIDIAGSGGTSWSEVERYRVHSESANKIASSFASWGIPTSESIKKARRGAPGTTMIASGGIRDGLDTAKAIALGSDAAGIATPLLNAARNSSDEVMAALQETIEELRISMFCISAATMQDLKNTPFLERKSGH